MANTPISGLGAGAPVTATDLFADVQAVGAGPVKVTAAQIKTFMANNLTLTGTPILPQTFTIGTVSYTWPAANGAVGSVLTNNGTGTLSWTTTSLGTVTSVGLDMSIVGLTVANTPITSSGNLVVNGGQLGVAYGGTGASTPAAALINLLPATSPATASYVLANDGSGNFYWTAGGGGGGGGGSVLSVTTTVPGLSVSGSTGNAVLNGVVAIAGGGTGATTTIGAQNAILPAQGGNAGKVLGTNGTNVSWVATGGTGTVTSVSLSPGTTGLTVNGGSAPVTITAAGSFTLAGTLSTANGGTGLTALGTGVQTALGLAVNSNGGLLTGGTGGILPIARGGTGLGTTPTNGKILIGNGTGYTLANLTAGSGITIDNSVAGAITINATGGGGGGSGTVTTVTTTLSGITITNPTTTPAIAGTLGVTSGGTGRNVAPTAGQLLIGNGTGYTLATLTAGTGVTIDNSVAGAITTSSSTTAGVTSFSGGSTGLQPAAATTGVITLAGTLNIGSGGTGLTTVGALGTTLVSNGAGALAYGNPLYATNLLGATVNAVPYQSAANTTAFAGPGAAGTYLAGNGAGAAPSFKAATLTLGSTVLNLNTTTTALTGMTGITMAGGYNPGVPMDVATKDYVDNVTSPVNRLAPVDYATTPADGNQVLMGPATIDGTAVTTGMRVLVKNQLTMASAGVYIADTVNMWIRATDLDQSAEFDAASCFVLNGATNANTSWIQTATVTTVDVTPQVWIQQSGIYNYTAGAGITLSPATTINNDGVLTFSGGTTGLTPVAATKGVVTLAGTLNIANGGTSATTAQGARTNILPTQAGQTGKFLKTNGTDVSWETSTGGAVYYIPLSSGGVLATKISTAGYTDAVGNSYVLYNNTATNIALTATSFPNFASFADCTATSITVAAGKTMLVTTTNTATNGTYAIDASNYLSGGVFVTSISGSSTMAAILTAISVIDNEGNVYVITNTGTSSATISALTVDNPDACPGFTTATTVVIPPKGTAVIVSTVASTNFVVESITNSVSTNLSGGAANKIVYQTAADATGFLPTGTAGQYLTSGGAGAAPAWVTLPKVGAYYKDITAGDTVQNILATAPNGEVQYAEYTFYNSSASSVAVSNTGGWSNGNSWPLNVTGNNLNIAPKQSVTISVQTVGSVYAITASSSTSSSASAITATANGTITAALTAASVTENPGMLVTIRNTAAANASITLTGTLTNFAPWAPASTAAQVIIQNGECVTLRVVTPGSAYDIVSLTAQNVAYDSTANVTLSATITTYGMQVGQLVSITNTKALGNITLTAAAFDNYQTYPVQSTSTVFTLPKDGTVTLELTSASNSNWRIVSYEYPGLQAGAIAFRVANTDSAGGIAQGPNITGLFNAAIWSGAAVTLNPQGYYDATNGKFTPLVAGYYQVNARINVTGASTTGNFVAICKNGAIYGQGVIDTAYDAVQLSEVVYMNGTTDYLQVGFWWGSGGSFRPEVGYNSFSAELITQQNIINTASGVYNLPTNADITIPTLVANGGITDVVGNEYIITNTDPTNNVTLTATNFIGYQGWIAQASVSTIVLTPGTVAVLQTVTVGTGYQIVSISPNNNVNSVAFSVTPTTNIAVGTSSAYPTNVVKFPGINFNPQNYYDVSTGRFTPKTAGYYQINFCVTNSGGSNYTWLVLYKNGNIYNRIPLETGGNNGLFGSGATLSEVVYMNGTTDYLETGAYYGSNGFPGTTAPNLSPGICSFSGYLTNQTNTKVVGTTAAAQVQKSASQAIANNTLTKVVYGAVGSDPQSWWDATNNRFKPTIPGYYQVEAMGTYQNVTAAATYEFQIWKNGGSAIANSLVTTSFPAWPTGTPTVVVYMNGVTDYLEMFTYQPSGVSQNLDQLPSRNNFSISLVGANQAVEAVTQTTSAYGIGSYNASNHAARYAVAQLDNIIIYQQYTTGFGFATVTGTTQLAGSVYQLSYGGGGGCASINNSNQNPWTITTAGAYLFSSGTMSTWVFTFRDLTANISYRATFILQHGFQNCQSFLERIGGQQL